MLTYLQIVNVSIKDRLFIYLIRQLLLRLKCQSTEISLFAATICLAAAALGGSLAAEAVAFSLDLDGVDRGVVGRPTANVVGWAFPSLILLIVRQGVNFLDG